MAIYLGSNKISGLPENEGCTIKLLIVTDTAPISCNIGDIYYNTITNLLYKCDTINTWSSGYAANKLNLYIDSSDNKPYYFNGTSLICIGGAVSEMDYDILTNKPIIRVSELPEPNSQTDIYLYSNEYYVCQTVSGIPAWKKVIEPDIIYIGDEVNAPDTSKLIINNSLDYSNLYKVVPVDTNPVGTVMPYVGDTAPNGYKILNGQMLSKALYPELYALCLNKFGTASDTHFYLPDLRGMVIGGFDTTQTEFNSIGKTYGEKKHTMTLEELVSHTHKVFASDAVSASGTSIINVKNSSANYWNSGFTGGGQPFNVIQPTLTLNYIIKAYDISILNATVKNEFNESTVDTYSCNYLNNTIKSEYNTSIKDTYNCNYINSLNSYSTDELRIGTWIDGKPIYRKIITGLTFTPKPAGETYTNNYLTVVEQLIDVKITRSGSSTAVAVCSANHPQNGNTMNIFAITEFSNCDTLILEFTKTTD